jgi:aryl sulfotransferase
MATLLRAPERVVHTPAVDSRRWGGFEPRNDDIVIGTFAKCGTTWTQRIVDMLVFQSADVRPFGAMSPWLDSKLFAPVEDDLATLKAQTHRRYIKSHLPFDALPVWDTVKYIHVGRDGRDARLSWQNHEQGFTPEFRANMGVLAGALAAEQGTQPVALAPPGPENPRDYLVQWFGDLEAQLDDCGNVASTRFGLGFFGFEGTYWRERHRPNLLLVHYNDLKEDLAGEMQRIADFLEIKVPESVMPSLVQAACFESMKKAGDALIPNLQGVFDRGAERFLNKGKSGRWRECLTAEDIARYEAVVARTCAPGLGGWLEGGRRKAGDPKSSCD